MTSADKPDTADVPAETTREERAVATASPAVEAKQSTKSTTGSAAQPATGSTRSNGRNGASPAPAEPKQATQQAPAGRATAASAAQPGAAKQPEAEAEPKPAAAKVEPKPATAATPAGRPAGEPESAKTVVTAPVEGPEVTSSAPPPWQRVSSDERYVSEHDKPGDGSTSASEATTRFSDWGYQRSPRSNSYGDSGGVTSDALSGGVVSGTAASSVFAATAGQSGVRPDARPTTDPTGRTTVNFNAPPGGSARPVTAPPAPGSGPAPSALRRPGRGPRRASLQVRRVDPWSVLKLAFVLSVALFFVWLVAVGVLYGVLDGMGVWDRVNGTYNEFAQNTSSGSSGPLITASRVFGIAAIIGAINIVLFTALATVGSFVYNVSADLAGGLEITLAERE